MTDQFSNAQAIRKPATVSKGGIVASQSRKAAEVGASVLEAGGDCVDAVIATTFALGVLEPWMSGLGGGGAMVLPPTSSRGRGSRTTAICMAPVRSRCPAWSPAWKRPIAATPECRGRICLVRA